MADFATAAELATHLGSPAYTGLALTRATDFLAQASSLIRLQTGQDLEETAGRQEEHAGDDDLFTIFLTQRPVTAVSSVTVDAVAFTDYQWSRWGTVARTDDTAWTTGPILVTYDSGYAADSDEMAGFRSICLEVAGRAMTGPNPGETFAEEIPEARGWAPAVFLTPQEAEQLRVYGAVPVG